MKVYTVKDIVNSHLKLIHNDTLQINISEAENKFDAKYVGEFCAKTSSGEWSNQAVALFYNTQPHPRGSNFFGLCCQHDQKWYIVNGISAVICKDTGLPVVYEGVVCDNQYVLYSAFRHDYQKYNQYMIDGGRDYTRWSGQDIVQFNIDKSSGNIVMLNNQ